MIQTVAPRAEGSRVFNGRRVTCVLTIVLLGVVAGQAQESPPAAKPTPASAQGKSAAGQDEEAAAESLQKATQNPVASLISVPLQNNTNFNIGPLDRTQNVLNIQPVIPVRVSENWNLITRIIMPLIYQPVVTQHNVGVMGLGDINPTFFLSPAKPGKLIWGIGPALVLPTATNAVLGQGKWSGGPSVVALAQPEHWTIGVLVNNVWNFAGESSRPAVNQMLLQYFLNYNMKKGWYITLQPIITANWKAPSDSVWTVPFGGGLGRIMKIGPQPASLTLQFYGNAVYPTGGSPWSMRAQLAFLFPKLTKEQEKMMLEKKLKELEKQKPEKK
jgi:hypothetical protein